MNIIVTLQLSISFNIIGHVFLVLAKNRFYEFLNNFVLEQTKSLNNVIDYK
jgi:hypothetical protein